MGKSQKDMDDDFKATMKRLGEEQTGPECGRDGCKERVHPTLGCPIHD